MLVHGVQFVHGGDPWKVMELATIYLAAYAIIFIFGPGELSVDQKLVADKAER